MLHFDPDLPEVDDLLQLFLNDTPLMDVRAPVEFNEGAFPAANNIPLINDEERHVIGKTYKDLGQDEAIKLGVELVSGTTKSDRLAQWQQFTQAHPEGVLYCFRGGMRSKVTQQWLFEETGTRYPRVKGGYKVLRRFLIDQLEAISPKLKPVVIGGRTGVGKTKFLQSLTPNLDLEGLAWHRGSAFGSHATPQPTQIDFENRLSIEVLKLFHGGNPYFIAEDESRNVGHRHMPMSFFEPFSLAPIIVLDETEEHRINITHQEYIHEALAEFVELHGEEAGFEAWADSLSDSLFRIRKRLGGVKYEKINKELHDALQLHKTQNDTTAHRAWIKSLLIDYYDSMYEYQLSKKSDRIVFTGNRDDVLEKLKTIYKIHLI